MNINFYQTMFGYSGLFHYLRARKQFVYDKKDIFISHFIGDLSGSEGTTATFRRTGRRDAVRALCVGVCIEGLWGGESG